MISYVFGENTFKP